MARKAVETPVQETKPDAVKVYRFKAENPYLTVANLGVQFRGGFAETANLNVARALVRVGGVEMLEE